MLPTMTKFGRHVFLGQTHVHPHRTSASSAAVPALIRCFWTRAGAAASRVAVFPRKVVLSGNPIGGVITTTRALRDLLTTRGNRLEVSSEFFIQCFVAPMER